MTANEEELKIKAVYSFGLEGIEILDILYGVEDKIIWRYSTDKKIHYTKIYYKNRAYFKADNRKIYLDECLRV